MTATLRDLVDEIDVLDLAGLAELGAPCVSVYLPTGRTKEDARRAVLELRGLIGEARGKGVQEAEPALTRVEGLLDRADFWQHQSEGLAVFADAETMRVIRLASDPGRRVCVGPHPHLVPLVDELDHHGPYHLLALGKGGVRLFAGTFSTLEELELGPVPASVEDMERAHAVEPELQHQHTPAARGTAVFHGHGGREVDDVIVGKFVQEIAAGVRRRLGADSTIPLYLAAVEEYLPRLQGTGDLPMLRDRVVAGNPEALSAGDLLERVRPLLTAEAQESDAQLRDALETAAGRALLTSDPEEIRRGTLEGRVDVLVVDAAATPEPDAQVDSLVVATMRQGGTVRVLAGLPHDATTAAILRY